MSFVMMKKVVIVGAGVGGIATGSYLARSGFNVTIFEKNSFPGGRCASFTKDGHRFDIGATLLMMPQVYERAFSDFGKNMFEELDLIRMDPVYRLKYPDQTELHFSSDLMKMQQQLDTIEPGSYTAFLRYMDKSYRAYRISMKRIIDRNYYNIFEFINFSNLFMLFRLKAFTDHYQLASRYFRSEALRIAFTFQNIYVGQNPYHASAIFSMLPFMELTDGVWFPKGGMNRVSQSLESIATENGVEFRYRSPVAQIRSHGRKAEGIVLSDGTFYPADIVIANADLPYVYQELLPQDKLNRKINRLGLTCSAVIFHWGMDTVLKGIEQHNIYVSTDYRKNIEAVFEGNGVSDDPSFYVHSPARADITAAPDGEDSISVIVPVGHLKINEDRDWEEIRKSIREKVLRRLTAESFPDFEKHIKFEKVYTPVTWQHIFSLSSGATFGSLNHNIFQMGYFRPHNQHPRYSNLYFAGGSTHPGNGVPLALISARLTAEKVIKHFA
jgi:phytoene desaturase